MRNLRPSIAAVCVTASIACSSAPDDVADDSSAGAQTQLASTEPAPIATSESEYTLERNGIMMTAAIPIRFTNVSPDTLYLVNCNGALTPVYEKYDGSAWRQGFLSTASDACLSAPIVIAPNETLVDTLQLTGALPGNGAAPEFASADVAGLYRLVMMNARWHYNASKAQMGDTVPVRFLLSNEFELKVDSTR